MSRYVSVCDGEVVGDVCCDIEVARNKAKEFLLEDLERSHRLVAYVAVVVEKIRVNANVEIEEVEWRDEGLQKQR